MINHVFVYGTLLPGDVRWGYLEQFVADDGNPDAVSGSLFDTGFDYPAAVFDVESTREGTGTILGRTFEVAADRVEECLAVLDVEEDTVGGRYRRVSIRTLGGVEVWAYEYGFGLDLTPIPSGDWLAHRPAHLALELTDD
jgi:gamma-glutamylcyclotransferase (GGCT)/AIG2-like uncharacterized protein YtfP